MTTALTVLYEAVGTDGWDEDGMLMLACEFIDERDLAGEFRDYVKQHFVDPWVYPLAWICPRCGASNLDPETPDLDPPQCCECGMKLGK